MSTMSADGSEGRVPLDALLEHRAWVRALARRLVVDVNDADDVEQETWRMALQTPPRRDDSPRGWLAAVVRNAARGLGRKRMRRTRNEAAAAAPAAALSPVEIVAAAEIHTRLALAVLDLEEPYRSTVLYRYFEGMDSAQIAVRIGIPAATVRTRLARAIERLRERMDVGQHEERTALCLLVFGRCTPPQGAATPAGAPGGVAAAAVAGGLAMAAATKTAVAAAVLVAAGLGWWLWRPAAPTDGGPETATIAESAAAPALQTSPPQREPRRHAAEPLPPETTRPADTVLNAPPPDAPKDGYVVRGRVLDDETSAPVAGVNVALVWKLARDPAKEPSGVSGADGTFEVAGAQDGRFGDILLTADGYAETLHGLPWSSRGASREKGDAGDLRLFRGRRVAGRVLREDGVSPVAGARIFLSTVAGMSSPAWFNHAKERGTSASDGTFALERVAPSRVAPYTLFAVAKDGLAWTSLPAVAGKADVTGVDVTLRPCGAVAITVRDETGNACASARIVASPRFEPLGPPRTWDAGRDAYVAAGTGFDLLFTAKTDARGVARLTCLPIGEEGASYDFVAYGRGVTAWKDGVRVEAGEEAQVVIVLVLAPSKVVASTAGARVVDPEGRPVEGARFVVRSGPAGAEATSGVDGVAIIARPEGASQHGTWGWFDVLKEGFATRSVGIVLTPDDGRALPTVVLQRPAPIEGRVVDQDGKPVAGAYVDLHRSDAQIANGSVTTGPDGKFSFPDATAGEWDLRVLTPEPHDEWRGPQEMTLVRGGDRDVVVALRHVEPGKARVVAQVVDADTGAPLSPDEAQLIPARQEDRDLWNGHGKIELASGSLSAGRVRAGAWKLWVRIPGRPAAFVSLDVAEGQVEVPVRVAVGRPGTLRGRLELGDVGIEMPTWVSLGHEGVWCTPEWAGYRTEKAIGGERVGPDGTFEFPRVAPGRYRLWIDTQGCLGEGFAEVLSGGEATAVVTFTKGAVVSFTLTAPSPTPIVNFEMARGDGPWQTVMRFGGQKGKTPTFDRTLKPGAYRWRVTFPAEAWHGSQRLAAEPAQGEVTVAAGETAVVDVPVVAK